MSNIFVSYSRQDKIVVDQIVNQLQDIGFTLWIDRFNIKGGSQWQLEITQAINDCRDFVLILSPDSDKSEYVRKELALALKSEKNVIPVFIKSFSLSPEIEQSLDGVQYIDIVSDYEIGIEKLKFSLGEGVNY